MLNNEYTKLREYHRKYTDKLLIDIELKKIEFGPVNDAIDNCLELYIKTTAPINTHFRLVVDCMLYLKKFFYPD